MSSDGRGRRDPAAELNNLLNFDRFRAIIDVMNVRPRWLVPVIRVALVLAFAGFTLIQLVGVPGIAWNELQHHPGWREAVFITPLVIIFIGGMACLQVITVCTWKLLTLVEVDEIFSGASARWVNGIVRAMYVGWARSSSVWSSDWSRPPSWV